MSKAIKMRFVDWMIEWCIRKFATTPQPQRPTTENRRHNMRSAEFQLQCLSSEYRTPSPESRAPSGRTRVQVHLQKCRANCHEGAKGLRPSSLLKSSTETFLGLHGASRPLELQNNLYHPKCHSRKKGAQKPRARLPVRPGGLCRRRLDGTLPVSN